MKNLSAKLMFNLALAGLVLTGTGCQHGLTTATVWQIGEYHPARIPQLQLATVGGRDDVLVQYDESFARSDEARPRAYWLFDFVAKNTNAVLRPKPEFVAKLECTNRCFIPHAKICQPTLTNGWCARLSADEHSFELWRDGLQLGKYNLPVYSNAPPVTWGRVLLTPITVATDAAIVTAVVFAVIIVTCPPMFGPGGG